MQTPQTVAVNPDLVESLTLIEFDMESESFRATYDSIHESTSLAVVSVVATVLGREPQQLTPLQSVIETDALDKLAGKSTTGPGGCDSISFSYEGFDVTVTSEEVIEAHPVEQK